MFNMDAIIKFLSKSGMRKVGTALYFETLFCVLLYISVLPSAYFLELSKWLILAVFAGNGLEHYIKSTGKKKEEEKS